MIAIQYIFICLVFGTTFLAIKTGIGAGLPPLLFAFTRFFAASIILLAFLIIKKEKFPTAWRNYWNLAIVGVLMTTIPFAALFWAETKVASGTASLMVATSPIFVGLIGKMKKWQWIGSGISLFGIYLLVYPDFQGGEGIFKGLLPKASIIISEFFFAIGAIKSKRIMTSGVSSNVLNGMQMLFASLGLFILSLLSKESIVVQINLQAVVSLVYLVVVASIIASNIYYRLVAKTNPLFPTTWTYVAPVIAIIVGGIYLHEKVTLLSGIGAVFVLGGVILVNAHTLKLLVRGKYANVHLKP